MHRILSLIAILFLTASAGMAWEKTPLLMRTQSSYVEMDGVKIHYKSVGKGSRAIVLVHGWTCDMTFWLEQFEPLSKLGRVVALDLPGHGASDKPERDYSMQYFARAVHTVMKAAGVEQAVIVGHSMGTPVAREFYRLYPEKTLALVAVDGSFRPFFTNESQKQTMLNMYAASDFRKNQERFIEQMFIGGSDPAIKKMIKSVMLSAPQHVLLSAMKGMLDDSIWKTDEVGVPVLAIYAKSSFWNEEYEKYLRTFIPNLDYQVIAGVGHFLMLDKPEEFNSFLIPFIKRLKLK